MASVNCKTYDEGIHREAELFNYLFTSGQSRALQYAFLAERKAIQVTSRWCFLLDISSISLYAIHCCYMLPSLLKHNTERKQATCHSLSIEVVS